MKISFEVSKRSVIVMVVLALVIAGVYMYSVSAKGSSGTIKVNMGDEFIIMLKANRTTGYGWQIDRALDGNRLEQLGVKYVAEDKGVVGSGGVEEWRFKAIGTGKSRIYFKYVRPWEKTEPAAEKKTFNVEVWSRP